MDTAQEFATDDLGLASLLVANGVDYKGLRATDGWKAEMVFKTPTAKEQEEVAELVRGWRTGKGMVFAQAFWRASRDLKHEVKQFTDGARRR